MIEVMATLAETLNHSFFFNYLERRLLAVVNNAFSLHSRGLIPVDGITQAIIARVDSNPQSVHMYTARFVLPQSNFDRPPRSGSFPVSRKDSPVPHNSRFAAESPSDRCCACG
jgi:hypothetical protein